MEIKLGLIGYGKQAVKLLSILQNKQDVTVRTIFHPDKTIDDSRFTSNFKDILDSDAVIIASPNHTHFNSIDILINCAGIFQVNFLKDTSLDDFEKSFNVNMKAPFLLCKEFSQNMIKKRWGRIVNIGSSSSYNGYKKTSIYCATKHALLGFSRSLVDELKKYNVRTFYISPGSIKTNMAKKLVEQNFNTFLDPKEVADAILFVISHDKEMIIDELRLNRMKIE